MPPRLRNLLLAFAFAAFVFGWAAVPGSARPRPPATKEPTRAVSKPTLGERAATIALKAVGVPYRWGGASPASGFDCSGLVRWSYGRLGIEVPHSSYALYGLGRQVARSRIKPGDVLFFSGLGHVGLYVGQGRMVHAPQSGRNVEVVALGGSYFGSRLVGARRVVGT
jgi:peptidoglycan DL-endopeptidase CwlO